LKIVAIYRGFKKNFVFPIHKHKDGTTAAERFFDTKPKAIFEFLLDNVDLPGRPAQRRRAPKKIEPLQAMI